VDVDVDLIGWVGVGLGGTYGCRCGISPYSLNAQRGCHTSELRDKKKNMLVPKVFKFLQIHA